MPIWITRPDLDHLNSRLTHVTSSLGFHFVEVGDDYLVAQLPIDARTKQGLNWLHGGASFTLVDSVGGTAANFCVDQSKKACVTLDMNSNIVRPGTGEFVRGTATPHHIGKTTHVWGIEIRDDKNRLCSISRLTMAVIDRPGKEALENSSDW